MSNLRSKVGGSSDNGPPKRFLANNSGVPEITEFYLGSGPQSLPDQIMQVRTAARARIIGHPVSNKHMNRVTMSRIIDKPYLCIIDIGERFLCTQKK